MSGCTAFTLLFLVRQIALSSKKLRGIPRRMRALERWSSTFTGLYRPRSAEQERFFNWKIPVHVFLVQGRQTNAEIQSFCVTQLLKAATHLATASRAAANEYYRVACLIVWPWLHQSEITIFYDKAYYQSFLGRENTLAPRLISDKLSLSVPPHFLEHGHDVTQPDDLVAVEWWCIGEAS
jgi:hypothetical protein